MPGSPASSTPYGGSFDESTMTAPPVCRAIAAYSAAMVVSSGCGGTRSRFRSRSRERSRAARPAGSAAGTPARISVHTGQDRNGSPQPHGRLSASPRCQR